MFTTYGHAIHNYHTLTTKHKYKDTVCTHTVYYAMSTSSTHTSQRYVNHENIIKKELVLPYTHSPYLQHEQYLVTDIICLLYAHYLTNVLNRKSGLQADWKECF